MVVLETAGVAQAAHQQRAAGAVGALAAEAAGGAPGDAEAAARPRQQEAGLVGWGIVGDPGSVSACHLAVWSDARAAARRPPAGPRVTPAALARRQR